MSVQNNSLDEQVNPELLKEAASALVAEAPGEWKTLIFESEYYSIGVTEYKYLVIKNNGSEVWPKPPTDTRLAMGSLRSEQESIGDTPFTRATLTIQREDDGAVNFKLDLDYSKPKHELD